MERRVGGCDLREGSECRAVATSAGGGRLHICVHGVSFVHLATSSPHTWCTDMTPGLEATVPNVGRQSSSWHGTHVLTLSSEASGQC